MPRIDWPAAFVLGVGLALTAAAYLGSPAEYRAETLAGLAVAWGALQACTRAVVRRRP
jgi:hypothetical protein